MRSKGRERGDNEHGMEALKKGFDYATARRRTACKGLEQWPTPKDLEVIKFGIISSKKANVTLNIS